jgi:hypothetical protein
MALDILPVTVISTAATMIVNLPPGPASVYVSTGGGTVPIWLGLGTALSSANGLYLPGGGLPFTFPRYQGDGTEGLYAISASGTVTATIMIARP